jgi:hypothetical protein
VIVALVMVWTGILLTEWVWNRSPLETVRQSSLFDQLCHAHGLDVSIQTRLTLVAKEHAHGDLILLFLDPRVLEAATRTSPDLSPLGQLLFGDAWQAPTPA